jgi:hypothetical protein
LPDYTAFTYRVPDNHKHSIMIAKDMRVTEFSGNHDFDCIIGLDILRMGDMAISNAGGVMVLSFRAPPGEQHIDFSRK